MFNKPASVNCFNVNDGDNKFDNVATRSSVLNPDPSLSQDGSSSSDPVMGSVEIAILGMALAVFFGALVAVVSILCIRAKR